MIIVRNGVLPSYSPIASSEPSSKLHWTSLLPILAGLLLPILVPFVQFGLIYRLWDEYNKPVHRDYCQNTCWDTAFKAGYETGAGSYKHVYFNVTLQTWVIWIMTISVVVAVYEAVKHLVRIAMAGKARWSMVALFLLAVYPHYYAWWAYFNYYNDDFYDQFGHQLFFTVTELASTVMVLHLADSSVAVTPGKLLVIVTIAATHIACSGWDQFVGNVLKQEGMLHQVLRDLGFMLPDILHIVIPVMELKAFARRRGRPASHLITNKQAGAALVSVVTLWLFNLAIM